MAANAHATPDETKITAKVPHTLYVRLKTYCAAHRLELKEVITEGMEQFLKNSKKDAKDAAEQTHRVSAVA